MVVAETREFAVYAGGVRNLEVTFVILQRQGSSSTEEGHATPPITFPRLAHPYFLLGRL